MLGVGWEWLALAGSGLVVVVTALGLCIETVRQTPAAVDSSSDKLWRRHEEAGLTRQESGPASRKRAA